MSKIATKKIIIAADIFPPDIGGPATYSKELAEFLPAAGFKIKLICYSDAKAKDNYSFKVSRIKRSRLKPWNYLKYFCRLLLLSSGTDIIYAQGPVNAGLPAWLVAKILRKKLAVKVVGDYAWEQYRNSYPEETIGIDQFQSFKVQGKSGWLKKIESLVCRQADLVITPSNYLNGLVVGWGADKEKVTTVYNAFARPENLPQREQARQELGFKAEEFVVVSIGRPVYWKGFGLLHIVVSELAQTGKKMRLKILGIGAKDLSAFIRGQEPINDTLVNQNLIKLEVLGKQPKEVVYKYLAAADAFALNTGYEGLSHVILEAMACGVPVITTNVCGNPELVENNVNGLLIDYNNKEQLKNSLAALYDDRQLGRRLAQNAQAVLARFSFQRLKTDTIEALNRLLADRVKISRAEKIVLVILALSFFVGLGYALGMVDAVGDEVYFVGAALKALQAKTVFPAAGEVPYGTITYFLNYILTGLFVILALPFFGFQSDLLKQFLIQNPVVPSLLPRLVSAFLALGYLALFYKLIKSRFTDVRVRIFLLLLTFTNILTTVILHTGKMWVLSTLLVLVSFYYLYRALEFEPAARERSLPRQEIFLSVLFSFLAFANFPLNFFALFNVPIVFFWFRKQKGILPTLAWSGLAGLAVFSLIILANAESIKNQVASIFTSYRPLDGRAVAHNISSWQSLWLNAVKVLCFFPLPLIVAVLAFLAEKKKAIANRHLFYLGLLYFFVYFLLISFLATWSNSFYTYNRYLFPLGFFLILALLGLQIKFTKAQAVIAVIAVAYFAKTIYLLAVPTTWNLAYDYSLTQLNRESVAIISEIRALDLPLNSPTAKTLSARFCGVKCQNVISGNLNSYFKPLVISSHTSEGIKPTGVSEQYYFTSVRQLDDATPSQSFAAATDPGFEIEGRLYNYFDWPFWSLSRLGPNIYIYNTPLNQ